MAKEIQILEEKLADTMPENRENISRVSEGNRGYIIRNGKPTYPSKVKIEVVPVNAE